MRSWMTAAAAMTAALSIAVATEGAKRPPVDAGDSEALRPVLACRGIAGDQDRLVCYDRAARALGEASAKRDIVVVDAQSISKARRSLFGFSMPTLEIFRNAKPDEPEQNEIHSTARRVARDADGNWIVTLDDGAVWHQTSGMLGGTVKVGDAVVIKRASLGSYFMRIGSRPGVRARREG